MKILVVRFRQMGDAILATPLLSTLRANYPDAQIDFVLNERIAPLFEGHPAISRVITFIDLNPNIPMTLEIVQHLLKDSIEQEKTIKDLTVEDIMKVVTEFYGVTLSDILSPQRTQTLVTPRQVAMFLSVKLTTRSLVEIGRSFGKTHATVYHGAQTIQKRIDVESDLRKVIENLTSQLGRNPSELSK